MVAVEVEVVLRPRAAFLSDDVDNSGLLVFIMFPVLLLLLLLLPSETVRRSWSRKVAFLTLGSSLMSEAWTTTMESILAPMLGGNKTLELTSLSLPLLLLLAVEEDLDDVEDDEEEDDVVAVLPAPAALDDEDEEEI